MKLIGRITKKVALFATAVVVLTGTIIIVALYPSFYTPPKTYVPAGVQPPKPGTASSIKTVQPGTYTDYSDDKFADAADGRRVLFFHATWCPQCRQLDKEISDNKIVEGVTILKVDYDTNQALRVKYGVTLQTTFVEVDREGKEIRKVVAYSEPTYANLVNQLQLHL